MEILVLIGFAVALIASLGAWINTHTILKDLEAIKDQLEIETEQNRSRFADDLDKD